MIKLAEIQLTKPGIDWIWEVGTKAALKLVLSLGVWGGGVVVCHWQYYMTGTQWNHQTHDQSLHYMAL